VTPLAVRILPALAAAAGVLLTADIARHLGASRTGQAVAALVLAISGWLGAGHLDMTTTFDVFFWTLALWLLVPRLGRREDTSSDAWRWLALGLVVGVALENKTLAITLPLTVGASLIALRRWDVLRSRWFWLAAVLALAIWIPNLVWQADHGFPQIGSPAIGRARGHLRSPPGTSAGRRAPTAMAQGIAADQGGIGGRVKALEGPWRPLGLAVLLQLGLMLVLGGKSYYSAGYLPLSIAAGAIPLSGWLRRGRRTLRQGVFGLAAVASGIIAAVVLLPIVPVAALHATPIPAIYGESIAQVGWPELAAQVAAVADALPAAQRSSAVIVTQTYGEYGALVLLGSGLPPVFSGHNSTWDWGQPGDDASPVILVAFDPDEATANFRDCRVAATIDNGDELDTQEQGAAIQVCAGPLRPWAVLWPLLRHIN
jgi:4-amino-4-deoxy-L-arabinose transferase-like glycosyltransferase